MLGHDVRTRIVAAGLTTGYSVFVDTMPDDPDKAIALNKTGGAGVDGVFGHGLSVEEPGLQLVVRGAPADKDGPELTIERLYQAMADWGAFTQAGGARYLNFQPLQAPFKFGRDASDRYSFIVNFLVTKEPSPTT